MELVRLESGGALSVDPSLLSGGAVSASVSVEIGDSEGKTYASSNFVPLPLRDGPAREIPPIAAAGRSGSSTITSPGFSAVLVTTSSISVSSSEGTFVTDIKIMREHESARSGFSSRYKRDEERCVPTRRGCGFLDHFRSFCRTLAAQIPV